MAAKNQADFRARTALAIVLAESARDSEAEQAAQVEYDRCERSCHYFINNHAIIEDVQGHGDGSGKMPFKLWEAQSDLLTTIMQSPRVVVLKARQLGISWLICVYCLWRCLFRRGQTILFFSQGEDEASELLGRVLSVFEEIAPALAAKLPKLIKSNSTLLEWDNGSRIKSMPATQKAGRGLTASLVVMDEAAWAMWAEQLYVAANATVADKGEIIICSTANGMGNFFHKIWQIAAKGAERFVAAFLPWHARPDRDQAFYDQQIAASTDPMMVKQEFPATPDEAFIASGRARFPAEWVRSQDANVRPGLPVEEWPATLGGCPGLTVYEVPVYGRQYAIAADVAEGLEHGDYSVGVVFDVESRAEVAFIRGKWEPDTFADYLVTLGTAYNYAFVTPERNNHGHAVLAALRAAGYDPIGCGPDKKQGWHSNTKTKPATIDLLAAALRDGAITIRSQATLDELLIYRVFDNGKTGAPEGEHDDCVMAWAVLLGYLAMNGPLPAPVAGGRRPELQATPDMRISRPAPRGIPGGLL